MLPGCSRCVSVTGATIWEHLIFNLELSAVGHAGLTLSLGISNNTLLSDISNGDASDYEKHLVK